MPVLEYESYEADDLLATIAHQVNELDGECYLVTGDKDCRQLITDRVKVYNVRKDQVYDAAALKADWGIRPEQVVDFQALVGDSVDNVPGVPLIGPKIAGEYLQKYDTLDELLAHADELPKGKRKDNLIAMREQALLSRELVRLERHVPVDDRLGRGPRARASTARRWPSCSPSWASTAWRRSIRRCPSASPKQRLASRLPGRSTRPSDWRGWSASWASRRSFSFDTETTHIWPRWAEIVGYSFSWKDGEAYYVPVRAPAGEPHLDPRRNARGPAAGVWKTRRSKRSGRT